MAYYGLSSVEVVSLLNWRRKLKCSHPSLPLSPKCTAAKHGRNGQKMMGATLKLGYGKVLGGWGRCQGLGKELG